MAREPSFRDELYGRYVSTFKGRSEMAPPSMERSYVWFQRKYLSLLQDCDRTAPVLELGSGPGYLLEFLRRAGFTSVDGIDVSPEQVGLAAERGVHAQVANAFEYLQTKKRVYGAVLAVDFLEHFTKDEVTELLRLIYESLLPGGYLLAQSPNGQGLFAGQVVHGDFGHLCVFTPDSLAQVLRLTGFADIEMSETGPIAHGWKDTVRVALWKVIKAFANLLRRIETGKSQAIWTENVICVCRRR